MSGLNTQAEHLTEVELDGVDQRTSFDSFARRCGSESRRASMTEPADGRPSTDFTSEVAAVVNEAPTSAPYGTLTVTLAGSAPVVSLKSSVAPASNRF